MYKHQRNSSAGGGSLKDEAAAGYPLPRVRKKNSEGDILDVVSSSQESQQWISMDETDALPTTLRFNFFDICCIIFSIITYVADLGMDCYVAYVYYTGEWIGYFVLTLVFVIVPAGTMSAFSLRWYVMDLDNQSVAKASSGRWVIRTIFLLLQLAPVLRYFDSLVYGLKSRRAVKENDKHGQIKYYTLMVNEDADATLLRLFEGFMESAPQVTLQLYILVYHINDPNGPFEVTSNSSVHKIQALAIITSLISLAWSLSSYHRSLRYAQPEKANISSKGTILQFVWHFCSISARIFAIAVFSASYPIFILPICLVHWLVMLGWLMFQGNQICSNQCEEAVFILVVAFIYIFTFFNIRDEPTRYKYLTYYIICCLENTILLFTWFMSPYPQTQTSLDVFWLRISGIVGDYVLFFIGVICMLLYYIYFHPSLFRRDSKLGDIEKDSCQQPPPPSFPLETIRIRSEFLQRKGSLDQTTLPLSSASNSNPCSRRNVTFAMDFPAEKVRNNSCGDSLDPKMIKIKPKGRGISSSSTPTLTTDVNEAGFSEQHPTSQGKETSKL